MFTIYDLLLPACCVIIKRNFAALSALMQTKTTEDKRNALE